MSETFFGQWDIYSLSSDGTNLSLAADAVMVENGVGVDNSGGGDTNSVVSGAVGDNSVDSAMQGGSSIDGDTFIGTIAGPGGATVFVVTDGFGSYFGVVQSGTDLSTGITSQAIPTNTVTWAMGCFAAGTMIATPDGERLVETLAAGDLVLTADGAAKPVRWLGSSTQSRLFADPARALPVRIKAGALGENLPVRDLLVSPGHAMLIEGVLVHAGALVNGTSVTVEKRGPESFTLYHVETDAHDLLIADGAVTESFLVGVEELHFDNWGERPAGLPVPAELSYPRVKASRQLPRAIREMIALRAAVIAPDLAAAA